MNTEKELRAIKFLNKKTKDQSENAVENTCAYVKNWKHMYMRSEKLKRAKQLGFEYPRISRASRLKASF